MMVGHKTNNQTKNSLLYRSQIIAKQKTCKQYIRVYSITTNSVIEFQVTLHKLTLHVLTYFILLHVGDKI